MFESDVALIRESVRRDRPLGDLPRMLAAATSLSLAYSLRPPSRLALVDVEPLCLLRKNPSRKPLVR
jgi:hypothetical protein